jgi:superfamily II DNA/RNA helicase
MNSDLTFFTNEPERNLYDRFNKILKRDTQFFDVLVGYFRASGFYMLQDSLDNVEHIRILIGINTDKEIVEMYKASQEQIVSLSDSTFESKKKYKENLKTEFENSDDSEDVEDGVNKFVEMLKSNKLELRIYTKQPIHAKLYVMRNYNDCSDYGKVITGSSNFSANGLQNNLEFNVELKGHGDVEFAYKKFNELWEDGIEVNQECIDTIKNETWIKNDITPYEMYLKFLYEYFKEEINDDKTFQFNSDYVIDGFKPLQYQMDAVIQAKRMLAKHNGVFISDVVGLGKTYMCALLAKELVGRKLFIVPPVLIDYWEKVLRDFGVIGFKVISNGSLKKVTENKEYKEFTYIFIDEAHKFRNDQTDNYRMLDEICTNKQVILITATPQNNYVYDIANQMFLFESKTNSTIPGIRKLNQFFANLAADVKHSKGTDEYADEIKKASEKIRNRVLREVMIRRTRTEIQKNYKKDLEKQGISFPIVEDPKRETYEFDVQTETVFEYTIESIKKLHYTRYKPMTYVKETQLTTEQNSLLTGQRNMGGFMKGILVKRLESSKYAFNQTLDRFIKSYEDFISMYNNGDVWISNKLKVDELLDREDIDALANAENNGDAQHFKSEDFNKDFLNDLQEDLIILKSLREMWSTLKNDCKLEYFLKLLKNDKNLKGKIIIFTESTETAEYISKNIQDNLHRRVILFNGSMSSTIKDEIRNNFDPNVDKELKADDYDVLVTTDVLAEGMNLHRSNVIINYDLPWNPTKVMQRVGRINRIGTKFDKLYIYNFFPTTNSEDLIHQEDNIVAKIEMFHNMLGEDSKYLTDEEDVTTYELFQQMNHFDQEEETGLNNELKYLKYIRDVRDNNPEMFKKVKELPKKIKIGRKGNSNELLTFFRKGYIKKFYMSNESNSDELNFDDAIKLIECSKEERTIDVSSNYYKFLKKNKEIFIKYENQDDEEFEEKVKIKGSSNAKQLEARLKEVLKVSSELNDEEIDKCNKTIRLLQDGEIPFKTLKNGVKMANQIKTTNDLLSFFKDFVKSIPETYYEYEEDKSTKENTQKEIVLSELFVK